MKSTSKKEKRDILTVDYQSASLDIWDKKYCLKDISGKNRLIIDGGHNESSSISISNWIKQQKQDVHLVCGMMKDKEHYAFMKHFKEVVKSITLIDIQNQ